MINNTFLIEIKSKIDNNNKFSSNDFKIFYKNPYLNIIYIYDDKYYFKVKIPQYASRIIKTEKYGSGILAGEREIEIKQYEFTGTTSPGNFSIKEELNLKGKSDLFEELEYWLINLWEEITISPEIRRINEIEEEINKINQNFENISEDNFSKDEIETLKEKLDILEQQFNEKLEAEIEDKENLKNNLRELHNEIEKLKFQSQILNKKNWFKSFGGKIFTWISKEENRKFLKDTGEFIKPLLPDSINNIL